MISTNAVPSGRWKKNPAPPHLMKDRGVSTSRESQSTKNVMVHSVVKGVSKLNICVSPPVDTECYVYEIGHDDGSHTTATATSSRYSGLSLSPQSPSAICQGPPVRLPPLPPPLISSSRNYSGKSPFPVKHRPKYYSETLERWSQEQQQGHQHRKKRSPELDWEQLELKKKWEQQQQQQQQQEEQLPEAEQPTARLSAIESSEEQTPCTTCTRPDNNIEKQELAKDKVDDDNGSISGASDEEDDGDYVDGYIVDDDKDFSSQMEGYQDDQQQKNDYEDPPLSAQTSYARQQLLQSSWYREMQRQAKTQKQAQADYDDDSHFYYQDDALCLDEVEISRGLGGYEEGFAVPTMNSHLYHHLPLSIMEEDEISLSSSVCDTSTAGKGSSLGHTEEETITAAGGTMSHNLKDADKEDTTSMSSSRQASACFHCRNGTCDNEDCSNSRFLI